MFANKPVARWRLALGLCLVALPLLVLVRGQKQPTAPQMLQPIWVEASHRSRAGPPTASVPRTSLWPHKVANARFQIDSGRTETFLPVASTAYNGVNEMVRRLISPFHREDRRSRFDKEDHRYADIVRWMGESLGIRSPTRSTRTAA